jgi:hypothetical protein
LTECKIPKQFRDILAYSDEKILDLVLFTAHIYLCVCTKGGKRMALWDWP